MSTQRARHLRQNSTDAERYLWRALRNRQLTGRKFRRQVPIGRYIADFVCEEHRLVIELDGGHHARTEDHDMERTRHLEAAGYRVLRFWNNDVLGNLEGVLTAILAEMARSSHGATRRPLPKVK